MRASFSLIEYLRADLQRAFLLSHGPDEQAPKGIALWVGIFSPRAVPVALCRLAYFFATVHLKPLEKLISMLNFVVFGIEISPRCHIGKGLFLPHSQGTVIGAFAIGENATIYQGVTLGARELDFGFDRDVRPVLGNGVTLGAGAKVLGGIELGDHCKVGANAVVLRSVAPGKSVVGIPAEEITHA
jgi:serine O-acetyltransferase